MTKKNPKITFVSFILSILIVIYHSDCKRAQNYINHDILYYSSEFISYIINLAVPTFFIISSALFYRNFTLNSYSSKVKSRIKSLLIPYLLWNTFYYILFLICSLMPFLNGRFNSTVDFDIINNVIGILNSQFTPLWFVKNLMIYTLVSPIIYLIISKIKIGVIFLLTIFTINLFHPFEYKSCLYWLPMYMFGALLGIHFKDLFFNYKFKSTRLTCLLILIIVCYAILNITYENRILLYIYRCLSPIAFWIIIDSFVNFGSIKIKDYYKYSFFIYANHFFLLTGIQKIIYLLNINQQVTFTICYFVIPPITIFLLILTASILEKKANHLFQISTGGR